MALSSRKEAKRVREMCKLIRAELLKVCSAQYQSKLRPGHQLKLDQSALRSLKHLADSDGVKALAELEHQCERRGRASCWQSVVMAYAEADQLRHQFSKHIDKANETLRSTKPRRDALNLLRIFLNENKNKNWAVLWGNIAAIERGLALLDYGIGSEESAAAETFTQIGATRKKNIKAAPMDAAIWVLAGAVKRDTGKAYYGEVATLASQLFQQTIDENIVKHAVHSRNRRFDAMQKKRVERLLDSRLAGPNFVRVRRGRGLTQRAS
jgi:hypothetical protein